MRLSYSKLNTYRQCPLRYRFTYLDRLPRRPRRLFRAAHRIHHALMRWLTYARTGSPRWDDVLAAYNSAWGALQDPAVEADPDYVEGLRILRDYHEANRERVCRPVLLEHKFSVPMGPHTLVGVLDRLDVSDTGYEVIDYKLDRELRTQEEVDHDLQLRLYHLAMEEGQGIRPEALSLYFLRHNIRRTTHMPAPESRELVRWVIGTGNDIAAERQWTPCPGDHCGGCDFKSTCPVHTGEPVGPPPERTVIRSTQMSLALTDAESESDVATAAQLALPL